MSEYERLVNDKDIKAYEGQQVKLNSILPGFGGSYEAEKQKAMVEKAFGGSPSPYTNKTDLISINPSTASKQLQSGGNTNSYPALDAPKQ